MLPGDDCEYVRKAIEDKTWGPKSQGGADIKLRFLRADGRRAVLMVRGRIYAAILVDLPCIVEAMKSFDRRAWWKTADICQMLLVLGTVTTEAEALEYPLPVPEVDPESWAYAHGLTPPMRWVRKRRFRNRVSARTIEAVEEEVERLLALDAQAIGDSKYETIDLEDLHRPAHAHMQSEDSQDGDDDADGEMDDYFGVPAHEGDDNDDDDDGLEADLEKAMLANEDDDMDLQATDTPTYLASDQHSQPQQLHQQLTDSEMGTPAEQTESRDDSEDDDSGSDDDQAMDEETMEQQADLQRQREEIADLQAAIQGQTAEYERLQSNILKQKKMQKIQSLKADLALKQAAIGEAEDD